MPPSLSTAPASTASVPAARRPPGIAARGPGQPPRLQGQGHAGRCFASELSAEEARAAGLPGPVEALLVSQPSNRAWVPEVLSWAGIFAVADLQGLDDAAWAKWVARKNRELYTSAVMRLVMNFTSPKLALSLASAYWGVIHHGSRLHVVELGESSAKVVLHYPRPPVRPAGGGRRWPWPSPWPWSSPAPAGRRWPWRAGRRPRRTSRRAGS
jgi:hypothetical protein